MTIAATRRAPDQFGAGRYAPSPSGELHLGNLRTAVLAWLFARLSGRRFVLRIDDLDRSRTGAAEGQIADLAELGLSFDGDVVWSSSLTSEHTAAIVRLQSAGLVYECYCSRREIAEATAAPQSTGAPGAAPDRAYPGTCRDLSEAARARKRAERPAALRLRAEVSEFTIHDQLYGDHTASVDDLVLRRNDGAPAYNLTVVVDDAASGIDQVVRGDDLLSSAPRQAYLQHLLGLPPVEYAHVPLVLNAEGQRLAKRDGAVTLSDLRQTGVTAPGVLSMIGASLGLNEPGQQVTLSQLLQRFDPASMPREPWVWVPTSS